jgi:hypothetical protein
LAIRELQVAVGPCIRVVHRNATDRAPHAPSAAMTVALLVGVGATACKTLLSVGFLLSARLVDGRQLLRCRLQECSLHRLLSARVTASVALACIKDLLSSPGPHCVDIEIDLSLSLSRGIQLPSTAFERPCRAVIPSLLNGLVASGQHCGQPARAHGFVTWCLAAEV